MGCKDSTERRGGEERLQGGLQKEVKQSRGGPKCLRSRRWVTVSPKVSWLSTCLDTVPVK